LSETENITEQSSLPIGEFQRPENLKTYVQAYTMLALIVGIIVALDQWTKTWVRINLVYGERWMPWEWLAPYARIIHARNTGAAFGMFQQFGGVFTILAIVVVIVIIYYFPLVPRQDWTLRLAMAMQLSGAMGNLIDRLTLGHVTDFVSVGRFPIFNVADSSITIGTVILIIGVWISERREKALKQAANEG
jgi:signal peptidase II